MSVPPEISPDTSQERKTTKTVKFTHERVGVHSAYSVPFTIIVVHLGNMSASSQSDQGLHCPLTVI